MGSGYITHENKVCPEQTRQTADSCFRQISAVYAQLLCDGLDLQFTDTHIGHCALPFVLAYAVEK